LIIVAYKKQYLKTRPVCKVSFRLPKAAAGSAKNVNIVGEFNDWKIYATPMKRLKSGDYTITMDLNINREYQYRYLIDETIWENDWQADKYVSSPYGDCENSVVVV
jgi:1,4-alpha-glucan branching enzyme